ncbi:homocysteine S-methyltransferase family protein [Eubacterium sp. 1001713B170207_170306_E7]|uniref:homocysteine S-methyltransferase family protein n=1 Tax=Eubacterium sp. 1001713B170207_170306_E7 TaxID=2787097 RepID=UPI001896A6EA|nr:homocysteine S-methyltransferase family protein [Eubacterium sp. 1001713B170207_170306_E7]
MKFTEALTIKRLYLDGAMGSLLQAKLENIGPVPEALTLTRPEIIQDIYRAYIEAGSDIITTCTFGANGYKLKGTGYDQREIITAAVELARELNPGYVALDIGPLGALIGSLGEISFDEAYGYFSEMVDIGAAAGADVLLIETVTDIYEMKAALLAAREHSDLPVIASMTFEENGRTLTGSDPLTVVTILEALGADAIGINCSTGPDKMMPVIETLLKYASVPVVVQPNAGLPWVLNGNTFYDITADEFAAYMAEIARKGAAVLGGCCGTTPEYIQKTIAATAALPLPDRQTLSPEQSMTLVATGTRTVALGQDIRIIGESINPTTNAALKEELRRGELSLVKKLALEQKKEGAHVLDINLGLPDIDEKEMMLKAVEAVSNLVDLPLQIDSSDPEVIEAVLRQYNGKPIINSVNGEQGSMERILPIARKYGACVLGLTMDEKGIPEKAGERLAIGQRIIQRAESMGVPKKNMLLDCLVLTASAQQEQVRETIKALELIRTGLQVPTVLGVSNISFGLPNRELMNRTFLTMALTAGLNTPIMNPSDQGMMDAVAAFRGLWSHDKSCIEYVTKYKTRESAPAPEKKGGALPDLKTMVVEGMKDEAAAATEALLKTQEPMAVVNDYLIPGLDIVGEAFETGEAFLPNLIFAAEAVQKSFEIIKQHLSAEEQIIKGRIVLATVSGDVHDIGKNILKVILENYGYEILDLGKDVGTEKIIETVQKENILLVGLSALMTTTVKNMAETVSQLHERCPETAVMVGGAVLNAEYAADIGADYYGKDAKAGVNIAQGIFEK